MNILLIDDDVFIHEILHHFIDQRENLSLVSCFGGPDALTLIEQDATFDIIVIDLKMPKIDGIQVLRALANLEYTVPIILISSENHRVLSAAKALAKEHRLDIKSVLTKPFPLTVFLNTITAILDDHDYSVTNTTAPIDAEDLRQALQNSQIEPYYQPQISMKTGRLHAIEILSRWRHCEYGWISPDVFIHLAEEAALIDDLTFSIMRQSFPFIRRCHVDFGLHFKACLNISSLSLNNIDLPENIENLARLNSIGGEMINLEITESRIVQNLSKSLDVLLRLRLKGFELSIDDFGTGFSSLEQLQNFPFTELKIDRKFVSGVLVDDTSEAIIETTLKLAKKLNMQTVAEGIETYEQFSQLKLMGCNIAQGYFIEKPLSASELLTWLKSDTRNL